MQDIDNNMDELFRKAAENYAPKKGESKWNDILPALSENSTESSTIKKNNSKKNTAFLLFLLLLIFSGIILIEISGNKTGLAQLNKTSEKKQLVKPGANNVTNKPAFIFHNKIKENKSGYKENITLLNSNESETVLYSHNINKTSLINNSSGVITGLKNAEQSISEMQIVADNKKISQLNNINSTQNNTDRKFTSLEKQRRLYIGFVAAPEFNQIKSQGIKKPGFDIGIIAGYKLNSKVSLETGLLLNKKNYFTDGKYFNMDKIGASMPAGMEVMSLKGSSSLLQMPVKLKYDVLHKKNVAIFSSAGISSYIITDEENDYLTSLNGSEQQMKGSYKKVAKYFAATVGVSAGYENNIGKFTSIRIEPYMQIPLKGVGMGSMHVTSIGLHIGIIKFIR